ncbi:MAG: lytic transglycosylase domain-containing protein [Chloracidobacterium sp.]|nr:lytic transglycosylase domain-containing protein [Chloracidobacterium sp.]
MKRSLPLFLAFATLSLSISAQTGPRTMDNFDRSQGVQVFLPPAPPQPVSKGQSSKKGKAANIKKTGSSRPVMPVDEGMATREMNLRARPVLSMGTGTNLKGFTTGNQQHDEYIVESSSRYGIDPLLIYAQMHQESSFKVKATSHKGASGLMQLMPGTARRFGVTKIYDPKQNIDAGVKYMRWLLDTFRGDVVLALAGYNAGEGAVMKYGWNVPPYRETREYVRRITDRYNSISDPRYLSSARRVNDQTAARLGQKESRPLTVIEPNAIAVRLDNGKMILVNQ